MLLDNRKLSHDLKRRINKQTKQKNLDDEETLTNMKFECINTLALSWPDALENRKAKCQKLYKWAPVRLKTPNGWIPS